MLPERTWPFPVRPGSFETVDNYLRRLRSANLVTDLTWGAWVKPTVRATGMAHAEALEVIAESAAGLRPGHFTRNRSSLPTHADGTPCVNCTTGLDNRFGCVRCTPGERIEQIPHDGPRVCRKHMMWVGPGTAPEEQCRAGADALRADRLYRRLRRRGLLDSHRLAEILACVDDWAQTCAGPERPADRFVIAMHLARGIFHPTSLDAYALRTTAASVRYSRLSSYVTDIVGSEDCIVLIDAIWLLVRAAGHQDQTNPHSFICTAKPENVDERAELEQLRSSAYPRGRHLHLTQYVSSAETRSKYDSARQPSKRYNYICAFGHSFIQVPNQLMKGKTGMGCGVCSNRRLLRGFNSLADTDAHLVSEWHPTKNGSLRPEDVMAGSERSVFWRCPEEGHEYKMPLSKRKRGSRCSYCTSKAVAPSVNAFSLTHPEAAASWHPELNGDHTPEQFVAGSAHMAWWRCPEKGHDYQASILNRVIHNRRCGYCARSKAHPSTNLAVTHPDTASRWHPTRNGNLTPADVLAGSKKKVWWRCEAQGHHYLAPVLTQARGNGCNVCSGHVIDEQNCMRTTRPDFARQFHPAKNGSLTPDNTLATVRRRVWWRCEEHGHEWCATGSNRVIGRTGCPFCSNARVWVGWNDMATTRPDLVVDWDWDNNTFTPQSVVAGTKKSIQWKCSTCGFGWTAHGMKRSKGDGCPACAKALDH
ncbi:hypothetical protein JOF42_000378 [Microbacterium phyllosphaerae]|uniref:Treble clef zinc finger domain-containing protein n=1 Tax=Microbacterium phyllosphaerae TaxID=124798 RepID=A0ABS4WLR3_9MICO|nr:zinc-ribbon domain-containing protein [Microbacterium phyllosphaerae]MBP2376883.1 hypothetical protein [Microbacterium phyllosphaerae]